MSQWRLVSCSVFILLVLLSVCVAASGHGVPLRGHLDGRLIVTPAGPESVEIRADVAGELAPVGRSEAQAVWIASAAVIEQLKAGTLEQADIGSGRLSGRTADGSTVAGSFSGRLRRLPSGKIGFESKFEISHGAGRLKETTGQGEMKGVADPATLTFSLDIEGVLSTYGNRSRSGHKSGKEEHSTNDHSRK